MCYTGEKKNYIVKYTQDYKLYNSARWCKGHLYYRIPYKFERHGQGSYVLILKFAEIFSTGAPKNASIDVYLGKKYKIAENLSIYEEVGIGAALDFYFQFDIDVYGNFWNGEVFIDEVIEDSHIILKIAKICSNCVGKLNAFLLLKGKLDDTDYS